MDQRAAKPSSRAKRPSTCTATVASSSLGGGIPRRDCSFGLARAWSRAIVNADALASDWPAAGIPLVGPDDFEYGKREGSHVDPDGNLFDISVHGYDDVEYAADRQAKAKKTPEKQPA